MTFILCHQLETENVLVSIAAPPPKEERIKNIPRKPDIFAGFVIVCKF